jgi:E3 ubiquitin-protein transferase RMND5
MEAISAAHNTLENKSNLSKALQDVDALISLLQNTRDNVATAPDLTPLQLAKLKAPLKSSFDKIEDDLKEVNKGLNQYQKALKDKFKNSTLPTSGVGESVGLASQKGLVDRAIAMHLLREGKFDVASTFVKEVNAAQHAHPVTNGDGDGTVLDGHGHNTWVEEFADQDEDMGEDYEEGDEELYGEFGKGYLQKKFSDMYHILDALRNQHNLGPAIDWARQHSSQLETLGSNLEFELSRLKFVELYTSSSNPTDFSGPLRAFEYARTTFPTFSPRYVRETEALLGALAYSSNLAESPYQTFFLDPSAWDTVSQTFTSIFTALLSLPSASPLHTAVTAGGIALPTLTKANTIITATRGSWTSVNELPVETPLPPGMLFHSIFVCPVSKEQATDANPPMMLPCGHVIAKESLEGHARGKQRVKCPYCPVECGVRDAKRVYI